MADDNRSWRWCRASQQNRWCSIHQSCYSTDEIHENIMQFIMIASIAPRVQLGSGIRPSVIAQILRRMNISRLRDIVKEVLSF
jgi:hypothetical protein